MTKNAMSTIFCAGMSKSNYPISQCKIPQGEILFQTNGYHQDGFFKTSTGSTIITLLKSGITLIEHGVHLSIIANSKKEIADFAKKYELTDLPRVSVKEYPLPTF